MNAVAIIPARFGSTRFPGKPLAHATGKFLVQHVCECVAQAHSIGRCLVATDDPRILDAVQSFGGEAMMTSSDHASGTDRIAEVIRRLSEPVAPATLPALSEPDAQARKQPVADIVLNVQGDEPEIDPAYLDRLVAALASQPDCPAATLACPFPSDVDPRDPNCVKVVRNRLGRALYFSRALIPYPRADVEASDRSGWLLHLGVYAYRRAFLLEFAGWSPGALERTERLEQLRILENGYAMAVEVVERASVGIDTPEDYEKFVKRIAFGVEVAGREM